MWYTQSAMKKKLCQKFNSSVAVIIALFGIAVALAVTSLNLVQSANATTTTDMMTGTLGEEPLNTTSMSSSDNNNNNSDSVLGRLFLTGEDRLTNFNQINQTYTEVSYVGNRTIVPPSDPTNTITAVTINATETGNLTLKLQPNGITFVEGESFLVSEGRNGDNNTDGGAAEQQQENATAVLVDLNGVRPNDPRSSTGVAFFSTNSTGQLAFLENLIAIYQVKASPAGTAIQMWEWKGADRSFEIGGSSSTMSNQTTITSALEEEE